MSENLLHNYNYTCKKKIIENINKCQNDIWYDSAGISNYKNSKNNSNRRKQPTIEYLLKIKGKYYPKWKNMASTLIIIRNLADMLSIFIII